MIQTPEERIQFIRENGYEFQTLEYISRAWVLFTKDASGFIVFSLLYVLLNFAINRLPDMVHPVGLFGRFLPYAGILVGLVFNRTLQAGFYYQCDAIRRNETTKFSTYFLGFQNMGPFILISLLSAVLLIPAILLLVLPGVYLAVAWTLAMPFLIFRKHGVWKAMELSRIVITRNWLPCLGFLIMILLINFAGVLVCGIGIFVSMPVSFCAIYAAYEDIIGFDEPRAEEEYTAVKSTTIPLPSDEGYY